MNQTLKFDGLKRHSYSLFITAFHCYYWYSSCSIIKKHFRQ